MYFSAGAVDESFLQQFCSKPLIRDDVLLTGIKGLPYKYSANVPSTPFAEAPKLVTDALNRMIWAGTKASEDEPMLPLNEVLVLGYYEDQHIGVSCMNPSFYPGLWLTLTIPSFMMMAKRSSAQQL